MVQLSRSEIEYIITLLVMLIVFIIGFIHLITKEDDDESE